MSAKAPRPSRTGPNAAILFLLLLAVVAPATAFPVPTSWGDFEFQADASNRHGNIRSAYATDSSGDDYSVFISNDITEVNGDLVKWTDANTWQAYEFPGYVYDVEARGDYVLVISSDIGNDTAWLYKSTDAGETFGAGIELFTGTALAGADKLHIAHNAGNVFRIGYVDNNVAYVRDYNAVGDTVTAATEVESSARLPSVSLPVRGSDYVITSRSNDFITLYECDTGAGACTTAYDYDVGQGNSNWGDAVLFDDGVVANYDANGKQCYVWRWETPTSQPNFDNLGPAETHTGGPLVVKDGAVWGSCNQADKGGPLVFSAFAIDGDFDTYNPLTGKTEDATYGAVGFANGTLIFTGTDSSTSPSPGFFAYQAVAPDAVVAPTIPAGLQAEVVSINGADSTVRLTWPLSTNDPSQNSGLFNYTVVTDGSFESADPSTDGLDGGGFRGIELVFGGTATATSFQVYATDPSTLLSSANSCTVIINYQELGDLDTCGTMGASGGGAAGGGTTGGVSSGPIRDAQTFFNDSWGTDESTSDWLFAIATVALLMFAFGAASQWNGFATSVGGLLGMGLALGLGFLPVWFLLLVVFGVVALAGARLFGGSGGGVDE